MHLYSYTTHTQTHSDDDDEQIITIFLKKMQNLLTWIEQVNNVGP